MEFKKGILIVEDVDGKRKEEENPSSIYTG